MKHIAYLNYLNPGYGHSQDDDLFWRSICRPLKAQTTYYVNKGSSLDLKTIQSVKVHKYNAFKYKGLAFRILSTLNIIGIKIWKYDTFIIQGFEEISILLMLLIKRPRKTDLILICTNNLSLSRLKRKMILTIIIKMVFKRVDKIIVHSKYEARIANLLSGNSNKVFIKKYHSISAQNQRLTSIDSKVINNPNKTIITCFGPLKEDKTLSFLLQFMQHPKSENFEFWFINIPKENFSQFKNRKTKSINKYLSESEYLNIFKQSSFIFLINNSRFEPKLSGTLCDCLKFKVPFITIKIYPPLEYLKKFEGIGIAIDHKADISKLFDDINNFDFSKAIEAFASLKMEYSIERIIHETSKLLISSNPNYSTNK